MRIHADRRSIGTTWPPPRRLLAAALTAAMACALLVAGPGATATAHADFFCEPQNDVDGALWDTHVITYRLCGVPDIDQRRMASGDIAGLPGDGSQYCVPTATMNHFAYIANRGYSWFPPGAANWQASPPGNLARYNTMTEAIRTLGSTGYMNTSATGGTTGSNAFLGTERWIRESIDLLVIDGSFFFTNAYFGASGDYSPTMHDMAMSAASGALVTPVVGWYTNAGTFEDKVRNGGHMMSMVSTYAHSNSIVKRVGWNDPASPNDGQTTTQSWFARDEKITVDETGSFNGNERTQSRVLNFGSAYLDAYGTISPRFALAPDPVHGLAIITAVQLAPTSPSVKVDTAARVLDVAVNPGAPRHPFIVQGESRVRLLDALSNETQTFVELPNPRKVVVGGTDLRTFVYDADGHIYAFDRDGELLARAYPDKDIADIAWDPTTGELLALAAGNREILRYPQDLGDDSAGLLLDDLPCEIASIEVDPIDGSVWIHCDGANAPLRVSPNGAVTPVPLDTPGPFEGLHVGDDKLLHLSKDGVIHAFDRDGTRRTDAPFDGLPGTGGFDMLAAFINTHEEPPGPPNVLPEDAVAPVRALLLDQGSPVRTVGTTHTVRARLLHETLPTAGVPIRWSVEGAHTTEGTATTGPDGTATISWEGTATGEDFLTAYADFNGDGSRQSGEELSGIGMSWVPLGVLAGTTRIETGVAVSGDAFGDGEADTVVLARSDAFADALAGTPLAVRRNGPLLLTNRSGLHQATKAEIDRVLPQGGTVYLLGGSAALAPEIDTELAAAGYQTKRLVGATRYETALAIAGELGHPRTQLLTTGNDFADALTAGAAAAKENASVILTSGDRLPGSVATYLQAHPAERRFAIGGPAARAMPAATPVVGRNRFETATAVADRFFESPTLVGVASGEAFPDGLTGGAAVGRLTEPLLLTAKSSVPAPIADYLQRNRDTVGRLMVFGGDAAIAAQTRADLVTALR